MKAHNLVTFLDKYLDIAAITDESNNGLQVESPEDVEKMGFSVDACMDVFQKAQEENCQMIFVHHGLIWGGINYVRGDIFNRLTFLIENGIGLYAAHLPLDIHKEVGNNVQMAHLLELDITGEFCQHNNRLLGVLCQTDTTIDDITTKIRNTLGEYTLFAFGSDHIKKVGIVTGSGTRALDAAIKAGCDTFITGEPKHMVYHTAKENHITLICAGHYKTETLGVLSLMKKMKEYVDTVFIDSPTGL